MDNEDELDEEFKDDLDDLVESVLRMPDVQESLDEHGWQRVDIDALRRELVSDPELRLLVRARYAVVEAQATSLEEHVRVEPSWWEPEWRPDAAAKVFGAVACVFPLVMSLVVVWVFAPPAGWPTWVAFVSVMVAMYHFDPATRGAVRRAVPPVTWQRLQWGRTRRMLRLGLVRLHYDWRKAVREEVVLPEVRERINCKTGRYFSDELVIRDASGLRSADDLSFLIGTTAVSALRRELDRLSSGAIALAGRRGVGKTTLLRALKEGVLVTSGGYDRLTVLVSAPARYEMRDFVLHLHASVCRTVLERLAGAPGSPWRGWDRWTSHMAKAGRRGRWMSAARRFSRAMAFALLALASGSLLWYTGIGDVAGGYARDLSLVDNRDLSEIADRIRDRDPEILQHVGGFVVATYFGVVSAYNLCCLVLIPLGEPVVRRVRDASARLKRALRRWRRSAFGNLLLRGWVWLLARIGLQRYVPRIPARRTDSHVPVDALGAPELNRSVRALGLMAAEQLRQIRFLQTHTSGWSGKVDAPKSLGLTVSRTIAHAEQPLTQPEVVDQLRTFLERAATTLVRAGEADGLVIAIDELDKFADPAQAHEFVNEIKTVFGVPGCVFLVSVSDDALTSFERRGIPMRDALDSAFTTMIAVEPFTLDEARTWLDRRVIGLPDPFACLCFCLSAGIPRELVRSAAVLHDLHNDHPGSSIVEVVGRVIAADVNAKLRAFSRSACQLPPSRAVTDLIVQLNPGTRLPHVGDPRRSARLLDLAVTLHDKHALYCDDERETARLAEEAASYLYLAATILELFAGIDEPQVKALTAAGATPSLDDLATARQALALDPHLAWLMTASFRERTSLEPRATT